MIQVTLPVRPYAPARRHGFPAPSLVLVLLNPSPAILTRPYHVQICGIATTYATTHLEVHAVRVLDKVGELQVRRTAQQPPPIAKPAASQPLSSSSFIASQRSFPRRAFQGGPTKPLSPSISSPHKPLHAHPRTTPSPAQRLPFQWEVFEPDFERLRGSHLMKLATELHSALDKLEG